MRSNAAKKQEIHKDETAVAHPKQEFLKLVEKQQIEYNEEEGEFCEVDFEEFLAKYGIRSEFA